MAIHAFALISNNNKFTLIFAGEYDGKVPENSQEYNYLLNRK